MTRPSRPRTPEFTQALHLANIDALDEDGNPVPQPECKDDHSYAFYEKHPTKEQARKMCAGEGPKDPRRCGLLELCEANAAIERPQWGVMGGLAWQEGRRYHLQRPENKTQIAA